MVLPFQKPHKHNGQDFRQLPSHILPPALVLLAFFILLSSITQLCHGVTTIK